MNKSGLHNVLTTKEISQLYDVADSTLRIWISDKEFKEGEYRKSGNTWLITRFGVERILIEKNMFRINLFLNNKEVNSSYFLGKKEEQLFEVWFETEYSLEFIDKFPSFKNVNLNEVFKRKGLFVGSKLKIKHIVVQEEKIREIEFFEKKTKSWIVSLKLISEMFIHDLKFNDYDISEVKKYVSDSGIKLEGD